jgi:hypothetical protein
MHKILIFTAFGWLTLAGLLHFAIDVVSQYARGKRAPGPETTLFYSMNTTAATTQTMAKRANKVMMTPPSVAVSFRSGSR